MPSPATETNTLQWLEMPATWHAAFLRAPGFPMSPRDAVAWKGLVAPLRQRLAATPDFAVHVLLQFNSLHHGDTAREVSARMSQWMPTAGLGIFPDQPAPTAWTPEDFCNLDIGEAPRPLMHPLLRLECAPEQKSQAVDLTAGTGAPVEYYVPLAAAGLEERWTRDLSAPIKDPQFFGFPYYFPLLNQASLARANAAQLERWLPGGGVYLRECAEEGGLLLIWRDQYNELFRPLALERA